MRILTTVLGGSLLAAAHLSAAPVPAVPDPRHISQGRPIPSEGYADQPYIVPTADGAWLCAMTTGSGHEGTPGQHVISLRSVDQGATWEAPVDVEPAGGPEASYAVLLRTPPGRIYCFYNHNTDRVPAVLEETGRTNARVDSLGHYVFKYSDDHGRSWSAQRHEVPVRAFANDRTNIYGGRIRFFWNVGRPLVRSNEAVLVLHKVGGFGAGFFVRSEGAFLRSTNILTERDPAKIVFETLPEGEVGLRTPPGGGPVAEEQSLVSLSDGSLYCVYRTIDGWPASAYSRDGGRHWTEPAYASYTPGGRRLKHPRAANFAWNCTNGLFLYWFHNHGGTALTNQPNWNMSWGAYEDRNPAWLAAGIERDGPGGKVIEWSQPEILLYDDDPYIRMSYPDLVEEGGRFHFTETQKSLGRVHTMPPPLVDGLFAQFTNRAVARGGLLLDLSGPAPLPAQTNLLKLPDLHRRDTAAPDARGRDLRAGFTLDVTLRLAAQEAGQALLDTREPSGRGLCLVTAAGGRLRVTLNDGRQECAWESDAGVLATGRAQAVSVIVDGGPKLILFVVDGLLCDGGDERSFGWGRYSPTLRTPNSLAPLRIGPAVQGLRIYGRALRVSEAVGNARAP